MYLYDLTDDHIERQHLQAVRRECLTVAVRVIARHRRSSQQTVRQSVKTVENALAVLDRIGQIDLATSLRFAISRAASPSQSTVIEETPK
jgi:hypothetical protein